MLHLVKFQRAILPLTNSLVTGKCVLEATRCFIGGDLLFQTWFLISDSTHSCYTVRFVHSNVELLKESKLIRKLIWMRFQISFKMQNSPGVSFALVRCSS